MFIDGYEDPTLAQIDPNNKALYKDLASRPYCTNSYDSAVGGGFDICNEIGGKGRNIAQVIAEYTPIYEKKVADANDATTALTTAPETTAAS